MDEYNNHHDCFFHRHPVLKHLLYGLLALIGAFLAFYVVTDWYFKAMIDPVSQMRRMDRAIEHRDRQMEKAFKKAFKGTERLQERANHVIRLEQTDDEYKILVDLVPLNNSEKNVEVKLMEENLRRAMLLSRGDTSVFLTSPISATLLVIALLLLAATLMPKWQKTRQEAFAED